MGVPSIDWEAESYPAHADFAVLPCFVAFFLAVRFLLDRFVFEVRRHTVHDFPPRR
jgi:ceramide synthetase